MLNQQENYLQRPWQTGWHDLVQLFFNEFSAENSETGAATLRRLGQMLAQWHPVASATTVQTLENNINQVLATFNWGFVRMAPANCELVLMHCAWPHAPVASHEAHWRRASAWVLEGLYSQWLISQGGTQEIPVRWKDNASEDVMIFRYALSEFK